MLQSSDEFWADEHETFVDQAAQRAESTQHIVQQTNGAEPSEISADIMEEHMKGCF
jgi:hypothetical protein